MHGCVYRNRSWEVDKQQTCSKKLKKLWTFCRFQTRQKFGLPNYKHQNRSKVVIFEIRLIHRFHIVKSFKSRMKPGKIQGIFHFFLLEVCSCFTTGDITWNTHGSWIFCMQTHAVVGDNAVFGQFSWPKYTLLGQSQEMVGKCSLADCDTAPAKFVVAIR